MRSADDFSVGGEGGLRGRKLWIGVVYFLLAAAPGCWYPVLANILEAHGLSQFRTLVFAIAPAAVVLSPLIFAAKADQKYPAERVLAAVLGAGTLFLYLAFVMLERGANAWWFIGLLTASALISAPSWSLLNTVTLASLDDPQREFGWFRVWGTLGWLAAGIGVTLVELDDSAAVGKIASCIRILGCGACFMLPHTPPGGKAAKGWRDALGLGAFRILGDRDVGVYFVAALLFSIPTAAYYMHVPPLLSALGVERVAGVLTIAQAAEVGAILGLGYLLTRWRMKWVLIFAAVLGTLRYLAFAGGAWAGEWTWVVLGICFQGGCWVFFFESGRVFVDRRVERGMRAQAQALLAVTVGGAGSLLGTFLVGGLFDFLVPESLQLAGWGTYWSLLAGMCVFCAGVLMVGYRGLPKSS